MRIGKKLKRIISFYLVITLVFQLVFPTAALALTGGPSQPEMQGFTPVGTSDMVDVFSGDFKYNIPLLDVGGYPVNLSYSAGNGMDAEASWVGLGWSLVPGNINRNMRGLPDDFKKDKIEKSLNMKPNVTYGLDLGGDLELAELPMKLSLGMGLTYNNYNGFGFLISASPSISYGDPNKSSLNFGLGLSAGSESGVGIQPNVSFSKKMEDKSESTPRTLTGSVGIGYNSRSGLSSLTIKSSYDGKVLQNLHVKDPRDNDKELKGYDSKTSISFASPSYVPASGKNFLNLNFSITAKLGGALFFFDANGYVTGSFNGQYLVDKNEESEAYGYLYMHKAGLNSLMDFNREKDGAVGPHTPNLPLASTTYDIYSVTGQGIGGMYRPFRNDVSMIHDKEFGSLSGGAGADVGLEFDGGGLVKGGVDLTVNSSFTNNGLWLMDNPFYLIHKHHEFAEEDPDSEPFYFKQAGEKTVETDNAFFKNQGGFKPVRVGLTGILGLHLSTTRFVNEVEQLDIPLLAKLKRSKRARRNEVINPLTVDQAKSVAYIKNIENYSPNVFNLSTSGVYANRLTPDAYTPSGTPPLRSSYSREVYPGHHISEITALRADGARYVYGIPAYNNLHEEASFNVSGRNIDANTGLVSYVPNTDDSQNNQNGIDNFYEMTKTPKYAHSYLLTEVLSADYVDFKDDGPTDDDLGSYTKINYSKVHNNYKWRVPYTANSSNYSEGLLSDNLDDKANYIYGEKEIWYTHSIETKTYIAEFHTSPRDDGYGVASKSGGRGSEANYKLDNIVLYSKQDKIIEANDPTHTYKAVPIKTVYFTYNYELCKGVENNIRYNGAKPAAPNSGKLTLKSVYFTYGNSNQGKLSPYTFIYCDSNNHDEVPEANLNPDYNMKAYDRWGNYKPVPSNSNYIITDSNGELISGKAANNGEFSYVDQSHASSGASFVSDEYSWAWNLSTIKLPSGGQINVDYEADDYAYVQDKKAMQMFKILGTGRTPSEGTISPLRNTLYDLNGPLNLSTTENYYLFFDVENPGDKYGYTNKDVFRQRFLEDENGNFINFMYFKFLMQVNRNDDIGHKGNFYEYVPGYVEIHSQDYGLCPGSTTRAYVRLNSVDIQDKNGLGQKVNPIAQAGWNYARQNTPRLAFAQSNVKDGGFKQVAESMISTFKAIEALIEGMNNQLRLHNACSNFETGKSFVRLFHPTQLKKGGGYRVKQIKLIDNWDKITSPNTSLNALAEYGQEYDYTTTDLRGNVISSGVASWEPGIGGDENPWKQPVFFEKKHLLAANESYYQEEPYGESFFPSPSVGYAKVTVKNLKVNNLTRRATGKTVQEFYTAKDFPTLVYKTTVDAKKFNPSPLLKILKVGSRDYYATSQGYSIELNDMHGKPKANWVYQEGKTDPISGTEFKYKQQSAKRLANDVLTISKTGTLETAQVGVDFETTVDMRESLSQTYVYSPTGNMETALFGIIPVPLPLIVFFIGNEKVRSRISTVTKVINRYGIQESTIAHDLGATVKTRNTLFDAETGEVVSTQTTNQYSDNIYTFNYPSHWRYETMGGAYKNTGVRLSNSNFIYPSSLTQTNFDKYFIPGDELLVEKNDKSQEKAWVMNVNPLVLKNASGIPISVGAVKTLTVIRSGRRNQQGVSIGSLVSKKQPWYTDALGVPRLSIHSGIDVISAGASELTQDTRIYCECVNAALPYNEYVIGLKGIWRPYKSYTYLTGRTQSKTNDNLNIREDGIFTAFSPFYSPAGGSVASPLDWNKNTQNWTSVNEVTIYSPYGNELENKDALNRYSSALFGYGNSLPIAVSSMSSYNQIAFDGFEDYDFKSCNNDHLGFKPGNLTEVRSVNGNWQKYSHTGKRSIKVTHGVKKQVLKTLNKCTP